MFKIKLVKHSKLNFLKGATMQQIIELLVVITPKTQGDKTIEILSSFGADLQLMCLGKGTADNTFADYFDVSEKEKKVFFALIQKDKCPALLSELNNSLCSKNHGTIMFTLPLKSAMYSVIEQMNLVPLLNKTSQKKSLSTRLKNIGERLKSKKGEKNGKRI